MRLPRECPRYGGCSAPVCPLDADWARRIHVRGDPVCLYLTEAVKDGAPTRFCRRPDEDIWRAATQLLTHRDTLDRDIQRKLLRAAKCGSQLDRLRNLRHYAGSVLEPSNG